MPAFRGISTVQKSVATVGLIVLFAVPTTAQEPPKQSLPKTASLSFALKNGWLRLNVLTGRIECTLANDRTSAGTTPGIGAERLAIQTVQGQHAFSYELSNSQERFSVDITSGGRVHIRRIPEGNPGFMAVEFTQERDRPLLLSLGFESDRSHYETASLWHLLIAHRQE